LEFLQKQGIRSCKKHFSPCLALFRFIAVKVEFGAMTNYRTYSRAISKEEAIEEIVRYSSTQFDPRLVEMFKKIMSNGLA